jgi:hypothetical protein
MSWNYESMMKESLRLDEFYHWLSYLKPKPPFMEAPVPGAVLSKENAITIIRVLLRRA